MIIEQLICVGRLESFRKGWMDFLVRYKDYPTVFAQTKGKGRSLVQGFSCIYLG